MYLKGRKIMGNNDLIVKAKIRARLPKILAPIMVVLVLFGVLFVLPLSKAKLSGVHGGTAYLNIFGFILYNEGRLFTDPIVASIIAILLGAVVLPLYCKMVLSSAKKCTLELYGDRIDGNRKTIFSTKTLKLPIEKIDNIMINEGFNDKIWGGKTVGVRSASGVIKFPWVQNADEFVSATLAKIEEFKKNAPAPASAPAPSVVQNIQQSSADELAKFKALLDNGTITQEEFDAKKKQLLGL